MPDFIDTGKSDVPLSQAVRCGSWVFISGQAAVHPETGEIVSGSLAEEMALSFQNLRAALEAAGSNWKEIVKVNCYLRRESDRTEYNQMYRTYFSPPYPVRTTTTGCLPSIILFEVDCVAYSPQAE